MGSGCLTDMAHTLCTAASFQLPGLAWPEAIGCVARYGAIMMNNPAVIENNSSVHKTTSAVGTLVRPMDSASRLSRRAFWNWPR